MSPRIAQLKEAVETMHKCTARHVESKPVIELFQGKVAWDAQGGYWQTYLGSLLTNDQVELIRLYESHGMDVRLSVEELLHAIEWKARKSLSNLFLKHGQETQEEALRLVREYHPDF